MSDASQLYNDTCKMIRSVLLPNKYGLFLCNLEREYRGLLGERLQWKRLGFHSLKDMIMKIPEVVTVEIVGDGQLLLHATPNSSTEHIANMVSKQRDCVKGYNVSNTMKLQKYKTFPQLTNLSSRSQFQSVNSSQILPSQIARDFSLLLSAFPQGLSPSDLICEYRRAFGRELYLCGFSSIIDLCFQLPNVVYVQNSGPDWLLLPAAAKETMKIVDLNNQREVKSLLKKFDSLFKKRLENSWKESGRLVTMLRGWCKQLEDEGDLQQNVEYIGDNLQDLKIGRDQKQYKGFGEDEQKLLKKIRDQRHRLEAERYSQQLVSVGGGCQNHVEGGGNKEQLFNREIHQMRDVNFDDEEEDYEMEAVRDEYSFSDLSVISVHRETVKIDANRKVTLHCIEFNGDTSTMWCCSQEIAHLIPVWEGRDILAEMLVVKNVVVECKTLDKKKWKNNKKTRQIRS